MPNGKSERNYTVREKNIHSPAVPDFSGTVVDCFVTKGNENLRVLHLGFCDESVFANVVHEAFFLCNLFSTDFLLLAGLVVLHRGGPDVSVLADEIQKALLADDFFLSNFLSHLNTSKPCLGFDNESCRLII